MSTRKHISLPLLSLFSCPYLRVQLRRPDLNPLLQGSVSFAEFILRPLSRPMFLRFGECSSNSWYKSLLESAFQDVILCPLGEDFDSTVFTDGTGYQNKRGKLLFHLPYLP